MQRRTKIVATYGPACADESTLRSLIQAGVDVVRINFSHVNENLNKKINQIRNLADELNQPLAIMADLQGPKIRIGYFEKGQIDLKENQTFTLYCQENAPLGNEKGVAVDYLNLCKELAIDDHLLLDDGLIELQVTDIQNDAVDCVVIEGGLLGDKKGINRKGGGLTAGSLTDKDKKDMKAAIAAGVDYISLSFVKNAADIHNARNLLVKLNAANMPIIAKIERTEALDYLTDIILAADAIMVARGDLGVEVGAAEVPAIQKRIIEQTRKLNKLVITATQMMESMVYNPQPTRAEVSDVANAILDGTDAVMLSAETASGHYPIKVISMVNKTCLSAEKHASFFYKKNKNLCDFRRCDQAIAMATMHVANHFPIQAIIALTESGTTAIWMSRHYSSVPIYAVSDNEDTVRKLSLVNNVFPIFYDYRTLKRADINLKVTAYLMKQELITKEGYVLLTRGKEIGTAGGTNCMEIIKCG